MSSSLVKNDEANLMAQLLYAIYNFLLFTLTHYGMGRHAWWITNVEIFSKVCAYLKSFRRPVLININ
jgi:hypothetical protein